MNFQNLRLASKLWLSTGLIVLGMMLVVAFTASQSASNRSESAAALDQLSARVKASMRWVALSQTNSARTQALMLSADPALEAGLKEVMADTSAQISTIQKAIEAEDLTTQDRDQLKTIAANRKAMLQARATAIEQRTQGLQEESVATITTVVQPAMVAYQESQRNFVTLQEQHFEATRVMFAERAQRMILISSGLMALLVVCILAGAAWLIRSIRRPLLVANDLAAKIAQGDLSMAIDTARGDEFGDLMKSLAGMNTSLGTMVNQVRHSTDSIATASAEIAQGNNDLAQRTEQTSGNLQSTASSMDHLTQTVQVSADNARQATTLAANASKVAQRGGQVVQQVVSTMQDINVSSRKIADIIGVIDGIAFQTNILALNAAVEAARAGEQGRGFAVVASEVRSLAQRSAEAAKEIKTLITTSVDKVASGTQLVSDAGATMEDIVQSVRKVADVIGEITAASGEQSTQISGINQAIGGLDQMTQQNAALVEQSAAAAESLRDQADQLARAVAVFKTSHSLSAMPQNPTRDITPRPQALAYKRATAVVRPPFRATLPGASAAKKLAAPAKAPVSRMAAAPPTLAKPVSVNPGVAIKPAPVNPAADEWETF